MVRMVKRNDTARVLVVDPDPIVAESIGDFLHREGYTVATAGSGEEALELIETASQQPDPRAGIGAMLIELDLPRMSGVELLKQLRQNDATRDCVPVAMTRFGKVEQAVQCVRLGAADYLVKPLVDDEMKLAIDRALGQHALLAENQSLHDQLSERFGLGNLVGSDFRMQKVYDLIDAVAPTKTTVLITGESGTGKTMVARAVHTMSTRSRGPFVTFSCGSIPETLLESELFGHVKGAFTGADFDKPGKCKAAHGGTLFIDEINSATPALQLKLLRVLQEKAFEPVGSTQTVEVDVRFVIATNGPLKQLVEEGMFREDLFYRINVVTIGMPSLRDRTGDVGVLAEHFLDRYCQELSRDRKLSEDAKAALTSYAWPGNVRELENAIERAVVLSKGPWIEVGDLPEAIAERAMGHRLGHHTSTNGHANDNGHGNGNLALVSSAQVGESTGVISISALDHGWTPTPLDVAMREPERQILLAALEANDWNRSKTADELGINRTTLYKKIKQYKLDEPSL